MSSEEIADNGVDEETTDIGVDEEATDNGGGMSSTTKILIGALVAIAVIAVCALVSVWLINRGGGETVADPLAGTQWQVRSFYNPAEVGGMASPVGGTQVTAQFADGQVAGSAGCNNYTAGYTVDGDSLTIGQAAVTMMFCDGLMDQEQAFLAAMQSSSSFKLETEQLHILNEKGQVVVDFVPYTAAPEATQAPPSADNSWERVKAAGKIAVGTSADYPPFESYVGPGQIDGFDIALMDEIGRRLGVQVQYQDFAFDGLGNALILEQIDAAIAAISVTPEREGEVDFSNVYLVTQDAILAGQDASISISSVDDLAAYRVGVQRGSVYASWLQSELVATGAMPAGNLLAYAKAEDAVRDLKEGRADLVVLDDQPAQVFVAAGGIKVVAQGLNQQRLAIAFTKGAQALKAEIDRVLTDLYNEGIIAQLAQRYLDLDQLLPTPIPGATSTPGPAPSCVDNLALVERLTQESTWQSGQAFTMGWRVANNGTCSWDTTYQVAFVSGDSMGGAPVAVAYQVAPGDSYDIQVQLVAPLQPGSYQGFWQMVNGQGQAFGERLSVSIIVPAAPTVTPGPTQIPVAGISFTVDRTQIKAGECVNLSWKVDNVKEVYFYSEGQDWQDHGVAGEGTRQECPPVTMTYYLRVVMLDGSTDVREITIYVDPVAEAPIIQRFSVDPAAQITLGQCVAIQWQVGGDVDTVKITANGAVLWQPAPVSGSTQHCPDVSGMVTYGIVASGPGGTSQGSQTINVVDAATATPEPTTQPDLPIINSFTVTPAEIQAGESVTIRWNVSGGTSNSRLLRAMGTDPNTANWQVLMDKADFIGVALDQLDEPGDYLYRLEAYNPVGDVVYRDQAAAVTAAQ